LVAIFVWLNIIFLTKNVTSGSPELCNINTLHVLRKHIAFEIQRK
jgi:hypothetical protein